MEDQQLPPVRTAAEIKRQALTINRAINEQVVAIDLSNPANFITQYLASKNLPTLQQMRDQDERRRKINAQQKNIDVVVQMLTYMSRFQQQMDSQKFRLMLYSYLKTYFMTQAEYDQMVLNVRARFNRAGMKGVQVTNRNQLPQFLQPLYDGITVAVYISKSGKITLDNVPIQNRKIRDKGAYWAFRTAIKAYNKYNKFKRIVNQLLANPLFEESRADFKKVKNLIKGSGLFKEFLKPDAQRAFNNFQQFTTAANYQSKQLKQEKFARARLTVANQLVSLHQNGYRNQTELNQLFNFRDRAIQRRNPGGGGGGGGGGPQPPRGGGGGGGEVGNAPRLVIPPQDAINPLFEGPRQGDAMQGEADLSQPFQTIEQIVNPSSGVIVLQRLDNRNEQNIRQAVNQTVAKLQMYSTQYSRGAVDILSKKLVSYIRQQGSTVPITFDNATLAIKDITDTLADKQRIIQIDTFLSTQSLNGYGNTLLPHVIFQQVFDKFKVRLQQNLNTYQNSLGMSTYFIIELLTDLMYLAEQAYDSIRAVNATTQNQRAARTQSLVSFEAGLIYFVNVIMRAGYPPNDILESIGVEQ